MPEVYTLRALENLTNNYDHRPSTVILNTNRNLLSPYPNSGKQTPSNKPVKSSSPSILKHSNSPRVRPKSTYSKDRRNDTHRSSSVLANEKRRSPIPRQPSYGQKPEMHYLKVQDAKTFRYNRKSPYTNDDRQQRKSNSALTHFDNHDQRKITTFMLTAPERENPDNYPSYIQRSPSPMISRSKKTQPLSFDIIDGFDAPHQQRRLLTISREAPINNRNGRLSKSKALESIQRSMDKYRFSGS